MKKFKLFLKSLISNHACVEGGRRLAWYFAVPMFIVAVVLSLVPAFVQTITRQGDSIVSSSTYEMNVASERFLEKANDAGLILKVNDGILEVDEKKWEESVATDKDGSGNACYIHMHVDASSGKEFPDLGVYYRRSSLVDEDYYSSITSFPAKDEEGKDVKIGRTYSFVLFTEKTVIIYVYSVAKGAAVGTVYGDFKSFENGYTLNSILTDNHATTWDNWKLFYRRAYDNNRVKTAWQTTGILAAINAGITIFMGLMLWVLTRGKNNLNWFTLWETQKIAYWATVSPAILAVGLGFLLAQFAQVIFPLLLGVRVMWLSMKLLRPENADLYPSLKKNKVVDVKPLKSK